MKCPKCQELGLKSMVYSQGASSTCMYCMPYYDEDGNYHDHDSNNVVETFMCSNNHNFSKRKFNSCWCGWKQE